MDYSPSWKKINRKIKIKNTNCPPPKRPNFKPQNIEKCIPIKEAIPTEQIPLTLTSQNNYSIITHLSLEFTHEMTTEKINSQLQRELKSQFSYIFPFFNVFSKPQQKFTDDQTKSIIKDWKCSLESIYTSICTSSSYFYLIIPKGSAMLFMAEPRIVFVSSCSRGFREKLKSKNIFFKDVKKINEPNNPDSEEDDDNSASSWLNELGVDCPINVSKEIELNYPIIVEGKENVDLLVDFLRETVSPQSIPSIISPIPFESATMKSPEVTVVDSNNSIFVSMTTLLPNQTETVQNFLLKDKLCRGIDKKIEKETEFFTDLSKYIK